MKGGHGVAPHEDGALSIATLVRLSVPGFDGVRGVIPEPSYGAQLQEQSIALAHQLRNVPGVADALAPDVPPEGAAEIEWIEQTYRYPDGQEVTLRRPRVELVDLAYGALHADTKVGLRHAPALHGLGLLELIDQADSDRQADPADRSSRAYPRAAKPTGRPRAAVALTLGISSMARPDATASDRAMP